MAGVKTYEQALLVLRHDFPSTREGQIELLRRLDFRGLKGPGKDLYDCRDNQILTVSKKEYDKALQLVQDYRSPKPEPKPAPIEPIQPIETPRTESEMEQMLLFPEEVGRGLPMHLNAHTHDHCYE